jgi:hypothetical protein
VRKGAWIGVLILTAGCGAHVTTAPPVPPRAIGGCTMEVLALPPQTPYVVVGQGYSLNMADASVQALFEQGCALGADALVAPVPPDALPEQGANSPGRLAGTFIRRCPSAACSAWDGGS